MILGEFDDYSDMRNLNGHHLDPDRIKGNTTPHSQPEYIITKEQLNAAYVSPIPHKMYEAVLSRPYNPQAEQEKVLDVGVILDSLCNVDLYWHSRGNCESEDVRKCRGKDCNYCGRYND